MAEEETEKQLSRRAQRRAQSGQALTGEDASASAPDGGEGTGSPTDDDPQNAGEQIREENRKARRAAAAKRRASRERERQEAEAIGLDAQEIVDDALARSTDSFAKWLMRHRRVIETVIGLSIIGWGGLIFKGWYDNKKAGEASDALAQAITDDTARIGEPEERNPLPFFASREERHRSVVEAYANAAQFSPSMGTGAMVLLGQASALLDEGKNDEAAERFRQAHDHPQAKHDAEIRGKALDGQAIALENKGDIDGALQAYSQLQETGAKGFVALAQYQQARLLALKGDKEKAKEFLLKAESAAGKPNPADFLTRRTAPSFLQEAIKQLKSELMPDAPGDIMDTLKQLGVNAVLPGEGKTTPPSPSDAPTPQPPEKSPEK